MRLGAIYDGKSVDFRRMQHNNFNDAVVESVIHRYIMENVFGEDADEATYEGPADIMDEKKSKEKKSKKKGKKKSKKSGRHRKVVHNRMRKLKGGGRGDLDWDKINAQKKVDTYTQHKLSDVVIKGPYNVSQIADYVYRDAGLASKQSRQSKLRKKLRQEKSNFGSRYRLTNKEAYRIKHFLNINK